MNRKKYMKKISMLLIVAILGTLLLPVMATESPTPLSIAINANYYPSETTGEYRILFTTMNEIPSFTELGFKMTLNDAKVDRANFQEEILLESDTTDISRGESTVSTVTFKLNRTTASGIAKKTAFCNLEIAEASIPSESNFSITEFYFVDSDGKTNTITPAITFEEGPIVPELTAKEKEIYDAIVALPKPETISFYLENGSIASLSDKIEALDALETKLDALSKDEKDRIQEVLIYNSYHSERPSQLDALYASMNTTIGIIEIAHTLKDVSKDDLMEYQFLISVFDSVKDSVLATEFLADATAKTELTDAADALTSIKTDLQSVINDADYEDKTYACGDQITQVQLLSSHKYYNQYLSALKTQIDSVMDDVDTNYDGREESKQNLLSYLSGYKARVQGIQGGVSDLPTMSVGEITRGDNYTITFTRKNTMPSSTEVEVLVIVTDEDGDELDETQEEFSYDEKELEISLRASQKIYLKDATVTVTAYYLVDDASFLIGSADCFCYTTPFSPSGNFGPGNSGYGNGFGSSGNTSSKDDTDSDEEDDKVSGGTVFPSDESVESEKDTDAADVTLFKDIATYNWAKEAIEGLYYAGIVNGMEEGVYNPAGLVTREQFAKMVVELFDLPTGSGNTNFVDVKADAWYAPYITAAMQAGYIQGQSNEYFGIGESIMRQDMATILYRALGDMDSKVSLTFTDKGNIATYAEDAIAELVGLGVLNGYEDGTFNPRGTATRAEAAKTIWGIYQILNQ